MAHDKSISAASGVVAGLERRAAWKYVGYPGFSRFMASSNDCFALRKFTGLNVRVLLKLQNNVVELERRLDEMDDFTKNLPPDEGGCASFRLDADSPREELLEEIDVALAKYNSRLVDFLQIHERPVPSVEQLRNIQTWLANYPNAIETPEQEFITCEKDLFAVQTPRRTQFGKWMESVGLYRITGFDGVGTTASGRYYDRNAWKDLGGLWLMFCLLGMLLGPMWALPFALDRTIRFSMVTAFAITFSIIVTIGTTFKASHRGILVAGYFTQLVLVLGLTPAQQDNTSNQALDASLSTTTIAFANATASVPTSMRIRTVTEAPSELSTSNPTGSRSLDERSSNGPRLGAAAITGIVTGTIVACCLLILFMFWYRRKCSLKSRTAQFIPMREPCAKPDALREAPIRDIKSTTMSQSASEIAMLRAHGEKVATSTRQPSLRKVGSNGFETIVDMNSIPYDDCVCPDLESTGIGNLTGIQGQGHRVDSKTPSYASTTLSPSTSSPGARSQRERRLLANSTPSPARTTWHPGTSF